MQIILQQANSYTDDEVSLAEGRANQYTKGKADDLQALIDNMQDEIDELKRRVDGMDNS